MPSGSNTSQQQQNTNQSTNQVSNPWAPTMSYLGGVLPQLQAAFNQSTANGTITPTNFVAGATPDQLANFAQMIQAGNFTNPAYSTLTGGVNAQGIGSNAVTSALSALQGYNPAAAYDPSKLASTAASYVSGQNIPGQVAAATQQGLEQARDVLIPGTESAAAAGGNTNSSRTGVAEGIIGRGLSEQAQNLASALSGQAYGQGYNLASTNAANTNSALLSAILGGGTLGNEFFNQGVGATGTGASTLGQILGIGATGGAGQQEANQAGLSNQLQQYLFGTSSPFTSINQYLPGLESIAGLGGQVQGQSSGTTTTTSTPSLMSTIGSLLGAGGAILGGSGPFGSTGLGGISGVSSLIGKLLGK